MDSLFHYPPDVFNLLVDTIPRLCKSKADVLLFAAGILVWPGGRTAATGLRAMLPGSLSQREDGLGREVVAILCSHVLFLEEATKVQSRGVGAVGRGGGSARRKWC